MRRFFFLLHRPTGEEPTDSETTSEKTLAERVEGPRPASPVLRSDGGAPGGLPSPEVL